MTNIPKPTGLDEAFNLHGRDTTLRSEIRSGGPGVIVRKVNANRPDEYHTVVIPQDEKSFVAYPISRSDFDHLCAQGIKDESV